jgi:2-isopropylmalate synthase
MDLGRSYEAVIRINSQSGKGGIAYVLEKEHGLELPRRLQIEFSKIVQHIADGEGVELQADRLWQTFSAEYLEGNGPYRLTDWEADGHGADQRITAALTRDGAVRSIKGSGNGPVDGFVAAVKAETGLSFDFVDYREHAMGSGANATAVAYVELRTAAGETLFGVGIDKSIVSASLRAVLSAVNRMIRRGEPQLIAAK